MYMRNTFKNEPTVNFQIKNHYLTTQVSKVRTAQVVSRIMIPGSRPSRLQSVSGGKMKWSLNHRFRFGKYIRQSKRDRCCRCPGRPPLSPVGLSDCVKGGRLKLHQLSWRHHRRDVTRLIWPDATAGQLQLQLINPAVWLLTWVWRRQGCWAVTNRRGTSTEREPHPFWCFWVNNNCEGQNKTIKIF